MGTGKADETDSDASKALAVRIFDENKELRAKIEQLTASNAELTKKKARSARESERQQASKHIEQPTGGGTAASGAVAIAAETEPPHFVAPHQRFCAKCGKENDKFKDEVVCDPAVGGCGSHVGAYEAAKAYEVCPTCGKKAGEDQNKQPAPLFKYVGSDPTIIQEIDKHGSK